MSMKSAIHNTFTTNKKLDDLEELGHVPSSNSQTACSESGPPDGGFRAWRTVFGCFVMQFCAFGYISSFGVYQDYYTRIYLTNYPPSAISWIGALTSFLAVNITLISGPLYDRGWFYYMVIAGSSLQSLSLFVLSFAKPGQFYMIFMVQGILSGIGIGLTYGPSLAVASQHFSRRRTLVMSLVTSGTPLGSMIHPIMLNHLLNGTIGFARGSSRQELPVPTVSYTAVVRKCSREVLFILVTVGILLCQTGYFFPVFYLQLDSIKHGIDVHFSFYSFVIMNAACVIGRCTAGIIATYTGVLNFTIASTVACSAIITSMIALSDVASVVVLGLAYGYFSGVYIALVVPLITEFTPDLSELGARMGICFAFTSREWSAFSGLVGGPISGALLGSQYRWWIPSLFSGFITFVGSSMFVAMRLYLRNKQKRSIAGGDT
ncbi:major facilitator superfamily domain-containing protein [Suillus subluteus]|nr:major facilitator superfamily domain-containing protein [Suillus subluteus]